MKIIIALLLACSFNVFAEEINTTTLGEGEGLYFDAENMTYADEVGAPEQVQCPGGQRPVVVCRGGARHPLPVRKPHHYRRCRAAYLTCSDKRGKKYCYPKSKGPSCPQT